ncbi:MAG TPA: type 1 glutamine amidotransferase [Reyranella sp.]|nr:type 1 glutamine amidotransferase [Reyranella sp.]
MFDRLLGGRFDRFDVQALAFPERVEDYDAYVVTGSSAGVYDDLPWIAPTMEFLRTAKGRAKLVGVCFGHQIMAEAFGGKVVKSPKGWGVGLHAYEVVEHAPWMDPVERIAAPVSHQDQVVEQPPQTRVLVASEFTPFAGLAWDDQPAISFQFHPEFDPAYAAALIEHRRGERYDDATADAAVASLQAANDRERVGRWIERFLSAE